MTVLLLLVQNAGHPVEHGQLLKHVASKASLNEHVNALRTILGDEPRVIESRHGAYEFTPLASLIQEPGESKPRRGLLLPTAADYLGALLSLRNDHLAPTCLVLLASAALGGVIWTFGWGALGGSVEPRGMAATIWFLIGTGPVVGAVMLVVRNWALVPGVRNNLGRYASFLGGGVLGALSFYGVPSLGYGGIRPWLEQQALPFVSVEHLLVVAWSSVIGMPALMLAARFERPRRPLAAAAVAVALQLGIMVGLTSAAVAITLSAFPTPAYESVRGLVAGLALRVGLALALLVRQPSA